MWPRGIITAAASLAPAPLMMGPAPRPRWPIGARAVGAVPNGAAPGSLVLPGGAGRDLGFCWELRPRAWGL